jgi:hypothetical protein
MFLLLLAEAAADSRLLVAAVEVDYVMLLDIQLFLVILIL